VIIAEDFLTLKNSYALQLYEKASELNKLYKSVHQPFGLTYPHYLVLMALWERLNQGTGTLIQMIL
jgi:DNA-binding MarR family transcriptional regulator